MTGPPVARRILITGASGAIGAALARAYATPERTLILQGRRRDALAQVAAQCREHGATVIVHALALDDDVARRDWLAGLCQEGTPDVVIANAGVNTHALAGEVLEPWGEVDALLDINIRAPLAMADAFAPAMARRGSGQLVFMSSLAAWHGLPVTPGYSASKAALKAYGEALRGRLAPYGVGVTVVMPGYVRSAMCDAMPGPKPWLWSADRAARVIRTAIDKNRARVSFPFLLSAGTRSLAMLPASVSGRLVQWLGYGGER